MPEGAGPRNFRESLMSDHSLPVMSFIESPEQVAIIENVREKVKDIKKVVKLSGFMQATAEHYRKYSIDHQTARRTIMHHVLSKSSLTPEDIQDITEFDLTGEASLVKFIDDLYQNTVLNQSQAA